MTQLEGETGVRPQQEEEEQQQQQGLLAGHDLRRPRARWAQPWGAVLAALLAVASLALAAASFAAPSARHAGSLASDFQAEFRVDQKLGKHPTSFMKVLAKEERDQDADLEEGARGEEIALCVTNLNLAAWKLVQAGAVIAEAVENCPKGLTVPDNKIACMINLAAVVASTSAAASFISSTVILCPGAVNPDAECATILAALFETFATFPAAEGQISLFCPKTNQTTEVEVYQADRRLTALDAPQVFEADRRLTRLQAPEDSLEIVFCTWQIAQTFWFFGRAGVLIRTATRLCPADEDGGKPIAACSEVIHEILTQFFNAAKFIAAATTTCVKETNLKAGCALGTLNFVSAITQAGSVASALANGACSDLLQKKKDIIEEDARRIKRAKHDTLRKLRSQKQLTNAAWQQVVEEEARDSAEDSIAAPLAPNASTVEVLRRAGINLTRSAWPPAACVADVDALKKLRPEAEKANWTEVEATFREWERKYRP